MIKHLKPRSKEEIKANIINMQCSCEKIHEAKKYDIKIPKKELNEYFKNAKDDKKFMKLINKGLPIKYKTFKLKYSFEFNKPIKIDKCKFYLYSGVHLTFSSDAWYSNLVSITNCLIQTV